MWTIKKLDKKEIIKVTIAVLSIPIIVKVMYFINILGIEFGSYLREISACIG